MMKTIQGLALRFFQKNKFITFSSVISVLLSVFLVVVMVAFATNAERSLREEVQKMYGEMDLSVGYNAELSKNVDRDFISALQTNKDIQKISPVIINQLKVDKLQADIYSVGLENDYLAKSRYHLKEDINENEVMMNESLAESLQVKAGQKVGIEGREFTVTEILEDLNASGLTPDMLIVSKPTAKELVKHRSGQHVEATYVLVKAKKNVDPLLLANDIKKYDAGVRIDIAEEDEFLKRNVQSLKIFIYSLAFLMLIITALLIVANFELFLYKYKNQFAILRSIGATTKQLSNIILIQSSLITIAGTIGGFLLAIVSHQYIQPGLEAIFSFHLPTAAGYNYKESLMIALASGMIIQIFMLIPAYKSSKLLPLKIMQENEKNDFSYRKTRRNIGFGLIFIALLLICIGKVMPKTEGTGVLCIFIAALFLLSSIYLLFPVYLSAALIGVLPIIKKLFGNVSYIAIKNLVPQVRKNTFVMLTISAMMIIAVFGSVMLKTIQQNEINYLKEQFPTSIVLNSRLVYDSMIEPKDLEKNVKEISGVQKVSSQSTTSGAVIIGNDDDPNLEYTLADIKGMEQQGIIPKMEDDSKLIVVSEAFLEKHGLKVGDSIDLGLYSEEKQSPVFLDTFIVGAAVKNLPNADAYIDWENTSFKEEFTKFSAMYITSNDEKQTVQELEALKQQYPELQVNVYQQSVEKANELFLQRWSVFIVVMVVILVCVMLGVVTTLGNNIYSKRKEFAILRTISVDRKGIKKVILTQVNLYIIIGLLLGIIAGLLFTAVILLIDSGQISIYYSLIIGITAALLLVGNSVFLPIASKIGKKKISLELTEDNK
ncbi:MULTISPECIES: ABC transporter permease [unclassified Niallia]|uniref:FtsX-like permease family protein n=1 Tax=unclassified Niallia TaxID=2837522 RepID=UPI001EDA68F0|nr:MULTISPECIES: ABC transporter permease [unclassified Niallia]MDL0437535.1 ABC transporter permease [Niallia sp. SS-2023]UPO87972.1 ABC transporter permease [Niallia sp. Man26]